MRYGREALLLWVCGVYTGQAVVTTVLYTGCVCLQYSHAKQSCWFGQLLSWFLGLVVWCRTPSRYQRSAVPCGYVTLHVTSLLNLFLQFRLPARLYRIHLVMNVQQFQVAWQGSSPLTWGLQWESARFVG